MGTAYYCANDETELATGMGLLSSVFHTTLDQLIKSHDPRVRVFLQRGVHPSEYAKGMEQRIASHALHNLCAYITCFYKPSSGEDFHHGLLSQWRGYGTDGGYAIQFSRGKLLKAIEAVNESIDMGYELQDVHYSDDNPLRAEVLRHSEAFAQAFLEELTELAEPIDFNRTTRRSPIAGLVNGPLEALLDYLVCTKNRHFSEERECRLSVMQPLEKFPGTLPVQYYNRSGLLVPYVSTPQPVFNVVDCIEWIVIGPGPRMSARFKSISQLVRQYASHIEVRPSHIPFTRF